jgi:hypothetical protein
MHFNVPKKLQTQNRKKIIVTCTDLQSLRYSTLIYDTLRYSTLLYATLRYSTLLYATLRYSTLLYAILTTVKNENAI